MIPPYAAPEQTWIDYDSEEPALRKNYPIVYRDQQYALFNEVRTDWSDRYARLAAIGWQRFDGDVWTIQLTARPGYYVTADQLEAYGLDVGSEFPPLG